MRVIGELLIFFLLFLTNSRVLNVRQEKRDAMVILAPLSLFLVLLHILAWGLDIYNLYGLVLSVIVLLSNFHALFRYSENLYIDHYSFLMIFWTIVTSILSVGAIVVLIVFYPISYSNKKLNINETTTYYEGSIRSGFTEKTVFGRTNLILHEFTPVVAADTSDITDTTDTDVIVDNVASEETPVPEGTSFQEDLIIVYVADKRSETEYSKNYLQLLASKGYTVCSADIYTDDIKWLGIKAEARFYRRMSMIIRSLFYSKIFALDHTKYTYNTTNELEALIPLLQEYYSQKEQYSDSLKFFIISDELGSDATEFFAKKNPELVTGYLLLNSISEYKTKGYGFITQTEPLLARILGNTRDTKGKIINKIVADTEYEIQKTKEIIEDDFEGTGQLF